MLINEVESIVGISKKSIRYYEDNGLLKPRRDNNNSYRLYDGEDIRKLKIIKFLRELNVSIKDLKSLNDGNITLKECMKERIKKINEEEDNYNKVKKMCIELENSNEDFSSIDITKYLIEMNNLNKRGFSMKKNKDDKSRKIVGAVISSLVFATLMLLMMVMIIYFQFTEDDKMPVALFIFVISILFFPLIGVVSNLILRIKEIKSGEEDEASKY